VPCWWRDRTAILVVSRCQRPACSRIWVPAATQSSAGRPGRSRCGARGVYSTHLRDPPGSPAGRWDGSLGIFAFAPPFPDTRRRDQGTVRKHGATTGVRGTCILKQPSWHRNATVSDCERRKTVHLTPPFLAVPRCKQPYEIARKARAASLTGHF